MMRTPDSKLPFSSNSTHSIVIELRGTPPMIMAIETIPRGRAIVMTVRVGDDVDLQINQGMTRAPIGFNPNREPTDFGEISVWAGEVPDNLHPRHFQKRSRLGAFPVTMKRQPQWPL